MWGDSFATADCPLKQWTAFRHRCRRSPDASQPHRLTQRVAPRNGSAEEQPVVTAQYEGHHMAHGEDEYRERVESEILAAIMRASGESATTAPVILSGKVIDACVSTIAFFAAITHEGANPEFADRLAEQLRTKMGLVQAAVAAGSFDFITVIPPGVRS